MAKKSEKIDSKSEDYLERVMAEVNKQYADGVAITADNLLDNPPEVVPVSPALDLGLHGGIPEGSWVTCSGHPKTGKTLTSLSFAAECQKQGRHVYYLNIEGRLKSMNIHGIDGLDPKKLTIYRSVPEKILTAKDYLNLAMKAIQTHPRSLIIIDSVSSLCDEREMDEGIGYENRGSGNKMFAGFCRQASNLVPIQKVIVWSIMHLTQNQGMFGGFIEKGSRALQYQADVQLRVKYDKAWNVNQEGKEVQIGQQVHWLIESCALGSPGMEIDSYIRYGVGIDKTFEIINLGMELGLIIKSGAWMNMDFLKRHIKEDEIPKVQGAEKLYKLLKEKPEWLSLLQKEINDILRP